VPNKKPEKTIESMIARLEEIASIIQSGETGLEQSIELYEEGKRLAKACSERLSTLQKKLETINPAELKDDNDTLPSRDDDDTHELGRDNPILLA
jgi:exodeoxyribonuclease VII small subunit